MEPPRRDFRGGWPPGQLKPNGWAGGGGDGGIARGVMDCGGKRHAAFARATVAKNSRIARAEAPSPLAGKKAEARNGWARHAGRDGGRGPGQIGPKGFFGLIRFDWVGLI
jgi:hypothetical protein